MVAWRTAKKLALDLPEAEARDHFGSASFRVAGKIFAQLSSQDASEPRALVKLAPADQVGLLASDPRAFSAPPHWGRHGWTWVSLRATNVAMLRDLLRSSWQGVAPKKLRARHDPSKS